MAYSENECLDELAVVGAHLKVMSHRLRFIRERLPDRVKTQMDRMSGTTSQMSDLAEMLLDISNSATGQT